MRSREMEGDGQKQWGAERDEGDTEEERRERQWYAVGKEGTEMRQGETRVGRKKLPGSGSPATQPLFPQPHAPMDPIFPSCCPWQSLVSLGFVE